MKKCSRIEGKNYLVEFICCRIRFGSFFFRVNFHLLEKKELNELFDEGVDDGFCIIVGEHGPSYS